jgi:hypothetical protein
VGEGAQLGQLAEERATDDRADARHAAQQILLGAPDRAGMNGLLEVAVHVGQLALEPADVLRDVAPHRGGGEAQPVLLRDEHLEQLPPPRQERIERRHGGIRQRALGLR